MNAGIQLAWLQLVKQKGHFAAALAGIALAVALMLSQIGLRDSLLATAVRLYSRLNADIIMTGWQYQFQGGAGTFPARRIEQATAIPGVRSSAALYMGVLSL